MALETQIVFIERIEDLSDLDLKSMILETFTGVSMINLIRAGEECNGKAIEFAKIKGYQVICRKTQEFAGEFTAILEYEFYKRIPT